MGVHSRACMLPSVDDLLKYCWGICLFSSNPSLEAPSSLPASFLPAFLPVNTIVEVIVICVLPFLPPKPEGLTMGPVHKFLTSKWFVQQKGHLLRLLVSLQFLYCRWQCDSRDTNVNKLPGTGEYRGIGKYVPERVEPPNLASCLRSQERIPEAEKKNKANIWEYSFYLQRSITDNQRWFLHSITHYAFLFHACIQLVFELSFHHPFCHIRSLCWGKDEEDEETETNEMPSVWLWLKKETTPLACNILHNSNFSSHDSEILL